ncbi:MAG: tetratricopeptide repeat protein [Spirochaetes bacterium]|nr:tetratricopeptide repeat protein [Spirochaetota bacterium]
MSKAFKKKSEYKLSDKKQDNYLLYLLIGVIAFVAFIPSLNNGFTNWDDDIYVTENWKIKALSWYNIKHIFSTTHHGGYEPLTEFAFAVIYRFFKLNARIYHLFNLLFHIANSCLVFYLIFLISKRTDVSMLAAVLFAIHPMRVESVAWISELKDVLFTLFFLISLIHYVIYLQRKNRRYYYSSILFFILCLLPKSQALMFPFVLILTDYFFARKINQKSIIEKFPYFLISAVFFAVLYFGAKETGQFQEETTPSFFYNVMLANFGLIFYLVKLVLPIKLSNCYPMPDTSGDFFLRALFYTAPFFVAIIALGVYFNRKNRKIVFAALFYLLNLLLVLQLKRINVMPASDRYTYIPYIGLFYLISDSFFILFEKQENRTIKISLATIPVIIVLLFSFMTWQRCKVWKDSYTLWNDTLNNYPINPVAHNQIAVYYQMEKKDTEKAIYHYHKAIEQDPKYSKTYNNLGTLYHDNKQYEKAIEIFKSALKLSNNSKFYFNIAFAYHEMKELDKAIEYYKKAISVTNNYLGAYNGLARALMEHKKYEEAEFYIKEALKYNPNYTYAYVSYADLMAETGRYKEAMDYFDKALKIMPDDNLAKFRLSMLYIKLKDYNRAEIILKDLIKEQASDPLLYIELARIYKESGDMKNFNIYINKALQLSPDNEEALKLTK